MCLECGYWLVDVAVTSPLWGDTQCIPGIHWWERHQLALHSNPGSPSQPAPCSGLTLSCASPPVQPRPLRLLTCLPTRGGHGMFRAKLCMLCATWEQRSIPLPFHRGEAEAGTITFHSYLVAEVGFQLRNPVI